MKDFDVEIEKVNVQVKELQDKIKPLNDSLQKLYNKKKKLREKKEAAELEQIKNSLSREDEIKYFLFEDGLVDGDRYKKRQEFWGATPLWQSGYYPDLEQVCLKLMLIKGDNKSYEDTVKIVNEVLPYLKEHEGIKRLGVFEYTCSEHGSYSVEISSKSVDLIVYRYHQKSVVKSFDNVEEMVKYVQKNHYYEDVNNDN